MNIFYFMQLNLLEILQAFFTPTTMIYLGFAVIVIVLFGLFKKTTERFLINRIARINRWSPKFLKRLLIVAGWIIFLGLVQVIIIFYDQWKSDQLAFSGLSPYAQRVIERYCPEWGLATETRDRRSCCLSSVWDMENGNGKALPFYRSDPDSKSGGCREGSANLLLCRGAIEWCDSDDGRLPIITFENVDLESNQSEIIERNRNILDELSSRFGEPKNKIAMLVEEESDQSVSVWALFSKKNMMHNGHFVFVHDNVDGKWYIGSKQ
jgi:hypothetical protein